jgi:hypothetical protein
MTDTTIEAQTVKVGDFFYMSWGYDQTNVDFYEVVGITPSGKSVKVQRCGSQTVSDDGPSVRVIPKAGPLFLTVWKDDETGQRLPVTVPAPVETKRLRPAYRGRFSFYVTSYADAYQWDGTPKHQTGIGWGH